jgi:chromosome segregation ATPase
MSLEAPLKRIEERAADDLRRVESRIENHITRLEDQLSALSNSVNFMEKQLVRDLERHSAILLELQKQMERTISTASDNYQKTAMISHTVDSLVTSVAETDTAIRAVKAELKPFQAHMSRIDGILKALGVLVTLIGLAATVYTIWRDSK